MFLIAPTINISVQIFYMSKFSVADLGWSEASWCFTYAVLQAIMILNYFLIYRRRFEK
jgi:hypothetical protein